MAVRVVRASPTTRSGKDKNYEDLALGRGLVTIGWQDLGDLSSFASKEELADRYQRIYADEKLRAMRNRVRFVWDFRASIQPGDLVVLPFKRGGPILVGKILGPYEYRPDLPEEARHARRVDWFNKSVPRAMLSDDALKAVNQQPTVYEIKSRSAKAEIRAIAEGHQPSGEVAHLEETHAPSGKQDREPDIKADTSQEEPRED